MYSIYKLRTRVRTFCANTYQTVTVVDSNRCSRDVSDVPNKIAVRLERLSLHNPVCVGGILSIIARHQNLVVPLYHGARCH